MIIGCSLGLCFCLNTCLSIGVVYPRLRTGKRYSCQYPQQDASSSNECAEFNRDVTEEILQRKPQTVVIIATIAEAAV